MNPKPIGMINPGYALPDASGHFDPRAVVSVRCVGYACGQCGSLWGLHVALPGTPSPDELARAQRLAGQCCLCERCGVRTDRAQFCDGCHRQDVDARELARIQNATPVALADYDGTMLCRDGYGDDNGYFPVGDAESLLARLGEGAPTWAWGCTPAPHPTIDLEEIVRDMLQDESYGCAHEFVKWPLVAIAQSLVTLALEEVKSFEQDYRTIVVLRPGTLPGLPAPVPVPRDPF